MQMPVAHALDELHAEPAPSSQRPDLRLLLPLALALAPRSAT